MSISLILMFSGAVKLWLEQEGEAQLCSKRCGLHSQVQPGQIHTQCALMSHSVLPQVHPKKKRARTEKTVALAVLKIYEPSRNEEVTVLISIMSTKSSALLDMVDFVLVVTAAPNNVYSLTVLFIINSPQVKGHLFCP